MSKQFPKPLYYFFAILISIISLIGISALFIKSSSMADGLAKKLNLKITPSYIGGEIADEYFDPIFDDNGGGDIVYPSNKVFLDGSLDLVRYVVHEPVYEARWQVSAEYWQIDLEYRSGPAEVRNIMVYIDSDGDGEGSTETLFDGAEGVCFQIEHPWDYVISVQGRAGNLYNSDRQIVTKLEVTCSSDGKLVHIRIPLAQKELQAFYTMTSTYHYVITGGYSQWDRGYFIPVEKRRSISRGGVKTRNNWSSLVPNIYDVLDNEINTQSSQLNSWDEEFLVKAVLIPIEIKMHSVNTKIIVKTNRITELKKKLESLQKQSESEQQESINKSQDSSLSSYGQTLFEYGKADEAEKIFRQILTQNSNDSVSLAFMGSITAMKAQNVSAIKAVSLVNEAYEYLDKAVLLASSDIEKYTAYMNRASVSLSVPESVFNKSLVGANDFLQCVELYKKIFSGENINVDNLSLSNIYYKAAVCYENVNKISESRIWYKEAARLFLLISDPKIMESIPYISCEIELLSKTLIN